MSRSPVAGLLLVLVALATAACASKSDAPAQALDRTPLNYDSTRDAAGVPAEGLPAASKTCHHIWVAVTTHSYLDDSFGLPMTNLCTVTQCTKCGLLHHECAEHGRR